MEPNQPIPSTNAVTQQKMPLFSYFINAIKFNYANFSGRARRREYWSFMLFNWLAFMILGMIGGVLRLSPMVSIGIAAIYWLATVVPLLAVTVRRLHDTSHSGWWILINLIPLIGGIIYLIWMCTDTKPETNQWGAPPK